MWGVLILLPLGTWFFGRMDILYLATFFFAVGAFFNSSLIHEKLNHTRGLLLAKGVVEPVDLLDDDDPIRQLVEERKARDEDLLRRMEEEFPEEEETEEHQQ